MCVRAPQVIGNARNLITLEATEALAELDLPNVGAINFCWFPPMVDSSANGGLQHGAVIKGIRIIFSKVSSQWPVSLFSFAY